MEWGRTEVTETEQKTRFPDVPEEIILCILLELPIRYLLRFRCVSKRWRFLISDPPFSISVQRRHVIIASHYYQPEFSLHCINDDGSIMEIPRPKPLQFAGCLRIGGLCNGLVLLNSSEDLFMWNPFAGCCKKVLLIEFLKHSIMDVSGLCYDSSTDDYKVVTWVVTWVRDGETGTACMVGSCRTKSWTKNCDPYYKKIESSTLVDEHLHWLVTESNIGEDPFSLLTNLIVCFVPQTNKFVKVPMPDCDGTREHTVGLGVLNGCLSLSQCISKKYNDIEVLVMKQYGEKESWTRLFVIPEITLLYWKDKLVPLCCIKDMVLRFRLGPQIQAILAWGLNKKSQGVFPIPNGSRYIDSASRKYSFASQPLQRRGRVHGNLALCGDKQVEA
ncbi:hypothetical protein RHGRI_027453 [Rhododendron griersonianum]|uniref:F-box domain-containing protein n=1 Tax=Rhododendron griersonianum TaxID=479676 RepID=A0AAV6J1J4_9ERIC|nr:hypothetical protein RHGRI_027453 [Rhododendron griersonianum]